MTIIEPVVTLEWATPNPTAVIEAAARTCYKSQPGDKPEDSAAFVKRIAVNQGHASVIEHAVARACASSPTAASPTKSCGTAWPPTARSRLAT